MFGILSYAFGGLLALLVTASGITAGLTRRYPARSFAAVKLRIQTWWGLAGLLLLALSTHRAVALAVLAGLSGLALREFLALASTSMPPLARGAVGLAYLAIPLQYLWAGLGWYGPFLAFLPLYGLVVLPLCLVLSGQTRGFLGAVGALHGGLLLTVFSLSHVGLLLALPARAGLHGPVRAELLAFFLLVLTQLNDVAQFLWGKWLGRRPVVPRVSPHKTVEGLLGGILTTTLLAGALGPWLTPLSGGQAALAGPLISLAGFGGDVIVSALKREAGVKDAGRLLPGHGGILDRLDSLTLTAPLFFYYVHYLCY